MSKRPPPLSRAALVFLALGVVVTCVFPPWSETFQIPGAPRTVRAVGYAPLWAPPDVGQSGIQGVRIDAVRVLLQMIGLVGLAAISIALGRSTSKRIHDMPGDTADLDYKITQHVITLWTIATHQEHYVKAQWNELMGLLIRRGIDWNARRE